MKKINIAILEDSLVTLQLIKKMVLSNIVENYVNITTFTDGLKFMEYCEEKKMFF